MANSDDDVFKSLDTKHPDYVANADAWRLYSDVLGESEPDKREYLPKSDFENESMYQLRLRLSEFIPESPLAVRKLTGALFKNKPVRDVNKHEILNKIIPDADGKGGSWDSCMEDVATKLLGYGCTRLLVNVRTPEGVEVGNLSIADEQSLGIRPYLVNYSPLSVIDWDIDEYGQLSMVRIKESRWRATTEGGVRSHRKVTRFIEYDKTSASWWDFSETGTERRLIDSGGTTHNLGFVPMICETFPKESGPMVGTGFLKFAGRADVRLVRAQSDLHYDTYLHAHPIMWVRTAEELSELGLGSNSFIKLDPATDEEVGYADPPTSAFEALIRVIEMNVDAIQRHTGVDPLGVTKPGSSVFQASGVSRAWSFETSEARILTAIADKMERIERSAMRMAVSYGSKSPVDGKDFEEVVTYPDEFDTAAVETLLGYLERASMLLNSETLMRTLLKRLAAALVGEVPPDVVRKIQKEIENNPLLGTMVGRTANAFDRPGSAPSPGQGDDEEPEAQSASQRGGGVKPKQQSRAVRAGR